MTTEPPPEAPWRDSMRPIRFHIVDARLLVLAVPWLFHPTLITTALLVLGLAAFRLAEWRGYRAAAAGRALRALSAGRRRALHARRDRRLLDYG